MGNGVMPNGVSYRAHPRLYLTPSPGLSVNRSAVGGSPVVLRRCWSFSVLTRSRHSACANRSFVMGGGKPTLRLLLVG